MGQLLGPTSSWQLSVGKCQRKVNSGLFLLESRINKPSKLIRSILFPVGKIRKKVESQSLSSVRRFALRISVGQLDIILDLIIPQEKCFICWKSFQSKKILNFVYTKETWNHIKDIFNISLDRTTTFLKAVLFFFWEIDNFSSVEFIGMAGEAYSWQNRPLISSISSPFLISWAIMSLRCAAGMLIVQTSALAFGLNSPTALCRDIIKNSRLCLSV